jgi:hypothetical protein
VSLHALGALWISRHGIGHGLAVLVGVSLVVPLLDLGDLDGAQLLLAGSQAALAAVLTGIFVRTRVRIDGEPGSVRLPLSGDRGIAVRDSMMALVALPPCCTSPASTPYATRWPRCRPVRPSAPP